MMIEEIHGIWGIWGGYRKVFVSKKQYTYTPERGIKMKILYFTVISLVIFSGQLQANIVFNDGLIHTINYSINDLVIVDYDKPGVGTTIEIINGGWVKTVDAYNESKIKIYEGGSSDSIHAINNYIYMYGGTLSSLGGFGWSNIEIYGGQVSSSVSIWDYTQTFIYGDFIGQSIIAWGNSNVFLYDGNFNELSNKQNSSSEVFGGIINNEVLTAYEGNITFHGINFYVNGNLMQYGQSARIYGIPGINQGHEYLGGTITGVLSNGDLLNVPFYIYDNSDITFIPEPSTIFILSLGIVFLRKRE